MDTIVATPTKPEVKAPTPVVKSKETTYAQKTQGDMPLEIYESENNLPYISKLLEIDDLLPVDTQLSVESIDKYITHLMGEKGYKPTTEAYRETLEGVKKELGIDKNTSLETTIERLTKFIEAEGMLKSLKSIDEEKILKQLKKSPTKSLMELVMHEVEKGGL